MSIPTVHKIYKIEHAKLDQLAKIKTFIPFLIPGRGKELLRSERSALKIDLLYYRSLWIGR